MKKYKYHNEWKKGIPNIHQKIKKLDFIKLKSLIIDGFLSVEIDKILNISYPTVLKYTKLRLGEELALKLSENGKNKKKQSNYIDGRSRFRNKKKDYCEKVWYKRS